jgi:hypothetical protein
MKKILKSLVFCGLFLTRALGALPESGTITVDPSVTGDILIFNGSPVLPEGFEGAGQLGLDATMNHNVATGQITGSAFFTVDLNDLMGEETPLPGSLDMKGNIKFSAKVSRAGAVTRLVGAKATVSFSADMADGGDRLKLTGSLRINFKKYEVDASQYPSRLEAVASLEGLKLNARGVIMGTRVNESINQSDLAGLGLEFLDDIYVSTDYSDENFAGVSVMFRNLKTAPKGTVAGAADSLLDIQELPFGAYRVSGKRDARTGVSQISLAGQTSGSRGTTAALYVNDSLEVQRGSKTRNTVKAYGYTITF